MSRTALNARALALGVVVATVLCISESAIEFWIEQYRAAPGLRVIRLIPLSLIAWVAAANAIMIAALSVPIWLGLARLRLNGWIPAGILGFTVTLAFWVATNLTPNETVPGLLRSGVHWALFGAVAGVATRWARPRADQDRWSALAGSGAMAMLGLWFLNIAISIVAARNSPDPESLDWLSNGLFAALQLIGHSMLFGH